jgi:hypothetical protein
MTIQDEPIFDAVVRLDKLPSAGRSVNVNADEAQRAAIAESLKILAVDRFVAELTVVPLRGGLRAQGFVDAVVQQASIISQEPVEETLREEIDRVFLPAPKGEKSPAPGSEVFIDLEDDEFPDHIDGSEVDLSALMLETLALALDPYPRRPGETVESLNLKNEGEENPFAKLAALKKDAEKS